MFDTRQPLPPFQPVPEGPAPIELVPHLVPDAPLATTRSRGWDALTADYHGPAEYRDLSLPEWDHHLICVNLEGITELTRVSGNMVHTASFGPGCMFIAPAGKSSRIDGATGSSLRMRISTSTLDDAARQLDISTPSSGALREVAWARDRQLERYAALLRDEIMGPSHAAQAIIVQSLTTAITAHLLRGHGPDGIIVTGRPDSIGPRTISRIAEFIEAHLCESIRLDQLAELAGISRFHFSRCFKASTGMTPMAFLERARIERAQALIRTNELSLSQIAMAVGYSDQSHFIRRFKRHVGQTPATIAREMRANP